MAATAASSRHHLIDRRNNNDQPITKSDRYDSGFMSGVMAFGQANVSQVPAPDPQSRLKTEEVAPGVLRIFTPNAANKGSVQSVPGDRHETGPADRYRVPGGHQSGVCKHHHQAPSDRGQYSRTSRPFRLQ